MPKLDPTAIAALRSKLTPDVEEIAFAEGTEHAFSHALHDEKRDGRYHCAVCDQALFSSQHKYNSGSGWPSFWQPTDEDGVETKTDYKLAVPRTEIHCSNCGAHLGHQFGDGPQPTGQRYCINGTVLDFQLDKSTET
jgi:peptide-methionine (R)-S-oxide reductase